MVNYQKTPPTVLLGIRLRYFDLVTGFAEPLPAQYQENVFPWWEKLPGAEAGAASSTVTAGRP
ncbi:hypothetical protein [Streptomyces syringium]|uniref:hypothetical protein n=1 Tax=Streptomyces syringium TaxID=76729 RepID=UPI003452E030